MTDETFCLLAKLIRRAGGEHHQVRWRRVGDEDTWGGASSTTTWALVPLTPNELIAARLGPPFAIKLPGFGI